MFCGSVLHTFPLMGMLEGKASERGLHAQPCIPNSLWACSVEAVRVDSDSCSGGQDGAVGQRINVHEMHHGRGSERGKLGV